MWLIFTSGVQWRRRSIAKNVQRELWNLSVRDITTFFTSFLHIPHLDSSLILRLATWQDQEMYWWSWSWCGEWSFESWASASGRGLLLEFVYVLQSLKPIHRVFPSLLPTGRKRRPRGCHNIANIDHQQCSIPRFVSFFLIVTCLFRNKSSNCYRKVKDA